MHMLSVLTLRELKRMKIVPEKLLGILEYLCEIKKAKEHKKPSQAALK